MKILLYTFTVILSCNLAFGQQILQDRWVPNGPVYAIEKRGDMTYVGGDFDEVVIANPNGVMYNPSSQSINHASPIPFGRVDIALPDHNGGFFINNNGAGFDRVGSYNRNQMAHIRSDGSVSPSFDPNGRLVMTTPDRVLISTFNSLTCMNHTGQVIWTRATSGQVFSAVLHNGTLYVGGRFTHIEGLPRQRLAAFEFNSGNLLDWHADGLIPQLHLQAFTQPIALAITGDELIVRYRSAMPSVTTTLISINLATGNSTWSWSSSNIGNVIVLAHDNRIYAPTATNLVVFDAITKSALPSPAVGEGEIKGLAVFGSEIFVARASGVQSFGINTLAVIDHNLAPLDDSNPYLVSGFNETISTISASGDNLYIGGHFYGLGAVQREDLFAFHNSSNELSPLSLDFDEYGVIENLAATDGTLYMQGYFTNVQGVERLEGLAAVDLASGTVNGWNPVTTFGARLYGNGETVYLHGDFSQVDGQTRQAIAAFDAASGQLLPWNASGLSFVTAFITDDAHVYAAGRNQDNAPEIRIYNIDDASMAYAPIACNGGDVYSLAVDNNQLFVGGTFTSLTNSFETVSREGLASIQLSDGSFGSLNIDFDNPTVSHLAASGGTLYITGAFSRINNYQRIGVAAIRTANNVVSSWSTGSDYSGGWESLIADAEGVMIGGWFTNVNTSEVREYQPNPYFYTVTPDRSNSISGTVFYDLNQNGVQEDGESGIPNLLVELQPGNILHPTNADGSYTIYAGIGDFTLRPIQPNYTTSVSPQNRIVSFSTHEQSSAGNNFGLFIQSGVVDASVEITVDGAPRPGFYFNYIVTLKNEGTTASNGEVTVTLDSRLLFQSSSLAPASNNNNVLTYAFAGLQPGQSQTFTINMRVPVPTIAGSLMGQELLATANVTPSGIDANSSDNNVTITTLVVGSMDPNDKLVTPVGHGPDGFIPEDTETLEYTIRFQNMGTAPAEFVILTDELDPNLDVTSFSFIAASHPYTYEIIGRSLVVNFQNIQLPAEMYDEPGSHGFFSFRINLTDGLPRNTRIENTASIVFDYNLPIVTNTVVNTLRNAPYEIALELPALNGRRGTEVVVPVIANLFEDVLGLQLSVTWDPAVASFVGLENFALPGLSNNSFNLNNVTNGNLSFVWSDPDLSAQSLNAGSALFDIRFALSGSYGATTTLQISHEPVAIEAVGPDYDPIEVVRVHGSLGINSDLDIIGAVQYATGEGVQSVNIHVSDGTNSNETITDEQGLFALNVLPADNAVTYTITPSKTNDPNILNGVDVEDLVLIRRHVLNIDPFSSPFQTIAADASNNGIVSIQDIVLVQSVILGLEETFPEGREWAFVNAGQTFTSSTSPFPFSSSATAAATDIHQDTEFNFFAIKIGDIDFSRDNTQNGRQKRQEVILEISLSDVQQDIVEYEVKTYGFVDISAYQFSFDWNVAEMELIAATQSSSITPIFGLNKIQKGIATTLWDDVNGRSVTLADQSPIAKIKFRKTLSTEVLPKLSISSKLTPMKMFDAQLQPVDIKVRFAEEESVTSGFFYPNPFYDQMKISFSSNHDQNAVLNVTDQVGKQLEKTSVDIKKGWNEIIYDGNKLHPGLYIFEMRLFDKVVKSKMVKK